MVGVDSRDGVVVLSLAGELGLDNADEIRGTLLAPGPETRRALEVSGLDRHFLVHDPVAEALEAAR